MNNTKSKILKAATELFFEGGVSALSVRAISKRAGLSTIGIYSHFKGKQGVLDELYMEGFNLVINAMSSDALKSNPKQYILDGVKGYLKVADEHEAHYRLIFGESDSSYSPSEEAKEYAEKAFERLVQVSSILLPDNASRTTKRTTALQIWALVHGFVSLKHHAGSTMINLNDWNGLTLQAISTHIDAIIATKNS
jgi:AcrR family transcriptional regulator